MNCLPFYTAFIGGGNPGILGLKNLEKIVNAVCRNGNPEEFTTEMNPESLSYDMKELFYMGLNRLSLGVQSLDENALKFLGRNTRLSDTLKGLELSQKISLESGCRMSYDLITCLGSFHNYMIDVSRIVSDFPAGHLSVYALTPEEGTVLFKKNPVLPDSDRQAEILYEISGFLKDKGYEHYEVSNYAKPGCKSLHNSVYWNYGQYIGFGPGAASTAFGKRPCRITFPPDVNSYMKKNYFETADIEFLSGQEQREELILMGLRHKEGLDLNRLKKEFGVVPGKIPQGFEIIDGRLVPDDMGLMTADAAALYIDSTW